MQKCPNFIRLLLLLNFLCVSAFAGTDECTDDAVSVSSPLEETKHAADEPLDGPVCLSDKAMEDICPLPKKVPPLTRNKSRITLFLDQCINTSTGAISAKDRLEHSQKVYDFIECRFRDIEFSRTPQDLIIKADLVDAIDALVEKDPVHFSPLMPSKRRKSKLKLAEAPAAATPLIPIEHLEEVVAAIEADQSISDYLNFEEATTANIIRKATQTDGHSLWKVLTADSVNRIATSFLGKAAAKKRKNITKKIGEFSSQMQIKSVEAIPYAREPGKVVYRGPKYLFGRSIHEFESINDWFARDLTPQARADYLERARLRTEKLRKEQFPGVDEVSSPIGICNADSRVSIIPLQPDQLSKKQVIGGKVLNPEAEAKAQEKRDDPAYYNEDYLFSGKNLFGRADEDPIQPIPLTQFPNYARYKARVDASLEGLDQFRAKLAQIPDPNSPEYKRLEKSIKVLKNKIRKTREYKTLLNFAQHEALGAMYRYTNRIHSTEVIQRLAPADIHNYVAPVEGTPLSHLATTRFLADTIDQKLALYTHIKPDALSPEKEARRQELLLELAQLKELSEIFTREERLLGRPSQPTFDIYGTNLSVARVAVKNQPRILSQNDRKLMLFKHKSGVASVHAFIGATGANRVNVLPKSQIVLKQGDRQGDMQFGTDSYEEDGDFDAADGQHTRDGLEKLTMRQGAKIMGHPIDGSTVVSYIPDEYSTLSEVDKFLSHSEKEVGQLELECHMGTPLFVRSEFRGMEIWKKLESVGMKPKNPAAWQTQMETPFSGYEDAEILSQPEKAFVQRFQEIFLKDPAVLTAAQIDMRERFKKYLSTKADAGAQPQVPAK